VATRAQAAGVPIIVAVNKIDKPGANPERIKQALADLNLLSEDWGGQTMFVPVSAIKHTNIDKLLESILLQAEVLDLKANQNNSRLYDCRRFSWLNGLGYSGKLVFTTLVTLCNLDCLWSPHWLLRT
jgi:translation initiation factor IF-2